jgi:hypothetical protein
MLRGRTAARRRGPASQLQRSSAHAAIALGAEAIGLASISSGDFAVEAAQLGLARRGV